MNERSVGAPVLPLFAGLALLIVGNGLLGAFLGLDQTWNASRR